jgi:glyoxylase-like metal-dependent hydrolase (beta-lactamase superfamily II)
MTDAPTSYRVGDVTVTRIEERTVTSSASGLLPDWDPAFVDPDQDGLVPDHMDSGREKLTVSIHAWLVRIGKHTIMVDTGIGNGKTRASRLFNQLDTPFLARLAAAGVQPEDVTHVLLTHIHTDHVAWNTRLIDGRWIPTFPNARYFVPRLGYDYFNAREGRTKPNYDMFEDSVLPVIATGQAVMVEANGGEVLDGFSYHPTPGHSVDHNSILLRSCGEAAMFGGDVMHHPIQLRRPEWNSVFCAAAEQARDSRRWALEQASRRRALYFSSHFAGTSAGTWTRSGDGFAWRFV